MFDFYDIIYTFLILDLSDETKFSWHIIIPGFHVENHLEAKAFADEVVKNLDVRFCLSIGLGVYKSLQNFCLYLSCKVGSNRVKQYKSGDLKAFSDSLIASIPDGSFRLSSIFLKTTAKATPRDDSAKSV